MKFDAAFAQKLDDQDELAPFRRRFVVEDPELIYMLGNSLGRLPRATAGRLKHLINHEWGERLIRGWNDGWIDLPRRVGDKVAQVVGARPGEATIADSTSVNLYKLAVAALRLRPERSKIVTDDLNFPSDLYILEGARRAAGGGYRIERIASPDGIHGPVDGLTDAVDEETALVALSHTVFKSAYTYNMSAITEMVHEAGALMLWDVSHAVGAVPIDLQGAAVDFAVGCTYKYLNAGPGAPAFLYVREDLQEEVQNPISGWMGQERPFEFELNYQAAPGLRRFLTGTPAILSLAGIEPGVELLLEAGMEKVRAKSVKQTEYLISLWETHLEPIGFELRSPLDPNRRGSHVALGHPEGLRISQALKEEMNVLPDFREPDNLRFSVAPLYTSFEEVYEAVRRLHTVVTDGVYEQYPTEAPAVT